jgi:hypothetical protein
MGAKLCHPVWGKNVDLWCLRPKQQRKAENLKKRIHNLNTSPDIVKVSRRLIVIKYPRTISRVSSEQKLNVSETFSASIFREQQRQFGADTLRFGDLLCLRHQAMVGTYVQCFGHCPYLHHQELLLRIDAAVRPRRVCHIHGVIT